ncbi:Rha family transcriptional regulator [Bacillus cereus group sp. BfR-BA-01380]|uniref:Rha family transcriptional regulator n=1 Tax=Bacillus cereus group sp. BfR-BA-01380 TaxID=2920324 RepID=UPI001F55E83B|nr:Rha family transcriptional regulator [Bacillus cereus group sp. BfR-BA-01380]
MTDQLTVVNEVPQQVLVFENNGDVVTDSLTVAEMFGKRHDHVMTDIRKQMEYAGEEFSLLNFRESNYRSRGKEYPKYNLTEEAFTLVVFGYNTREAVQTKIKFIQEFKRLKEYIQKQQKVPNDPFGQIELLAAGTSNLNKRVSTLENVVENQLTIDYGQQRVIEKTKAKRIYYLRDNCHINSEVHDSTRKLFGLLGRNLKDAFNVNSYRDILKKDFNEALNFINGWRPMI